MRRKAGSLVPLEARILEAALAARAAGERQLHGFRIARLIADQGDAQRLVGHGTLYKALGRLESAGLLSSEWEDPDLATDEGRPRRRLYELTGAAEPALAAYRRGEVKPAYGGRVAWEL